ncbi:MAG: COR domain-containing protein [Pseudonocardiaceae bacterium]
MRAQVGQAKRRIDDAFRNNQSYLDLSYLQLTTLPPSLTHLTNLTTLYLHGNQLTALPEGLANLTNFTLDFNQLTALPDWLADLTTLEYLSVEGNPLASPPPEIVAGGTESILAFLRARADEGASQWVSKLLVVGEGGVGKTSLIKALAGDEHDRGEPTTHGLQIRPLYFDHPSQPSVRIRLSTWDFGGQQIYHATHQFFLTNRSLFLLLWNSRLGWEQGRLPYWLDIITARAPGSPIILVATHIEGRPVDLPIDDFRREYPMIIKDISVDSESRHGVEALYAQLIEEAAKLPLMGVKWPTVWLAAAESLRNSADKHVTPQRMWQIMVTTGLRDTAQQQHLAEALHHLGDILYYHEDRELSQTVILRPEWVSEYISKVLDSPQVATAEGLLTRHHMRELWWDLSPNLQEHFLGMMDKYDLSYRVDESTTDDVSLVVERPPWNPPHFQDQWDAIGNLGNTQEIRVLYRLNTMPPGIPTWFIARSHRFSKKTHWRTGALLQHTDGRHLALARADRHRNIVELTVRGPSPAAFFSILDDGLNRTLERFPGLNIVRQVPCPCQKPHGGICAEMFDYRDLRSHLERTPPRHDIECRKSGELVPVPQLLLGLAPSEQDATRMQLNMQLKQIQQVRRAVARVDEKVTDQTEYAQRMFLKLHSMGRGSRKPAAPASSRWFPSESGYPSVRRMSCGCTARSPVSGIVCRNRRAATRSRNPMNGSAGSAPTCSTCSPCSNSPPRWWDRFSG